MRYQIILSDINARPGATRKVRVRDKPKHTFRDSLTGRCYESEGLKTRGQARSRASLTCYFGKPGRATDVTMTLYEYADRYLFRALQWYAATAGITTWQDGSYCWSSFRKTGLRLHITAPYNAHYGPAHPDADSVDDMKVLKRHVCRLVRNTPKNGDVDMAQYEAFGGKRGSPASSTVRSGYVPEPVG